MRAIALMDRSDCLQHLTPWLHCHCAKDQLLLALVGAVVLGEANLSLAIPQKKRWQYRLLSLKQAYAQFKNALDLAEKRELSSLEKQGLIQSFEFTHELAWNAMRDFLLERGHTDIYGSKDTTRLAFQKGLIDAGEDWMKMIEHRNLSSHTYKEQTAEAIIEKAKGDYGRLFGALIDRLEAIEQQEDQKS